MALRPQEVASVQITRILPLVTGGLGGCLGRRLDRTRVAVVQLSPTGANRAFSFPYTYSPVRMSRWIRQRKLVEVYCDGMSVVCSAVCGRPAGGAHACYTSVSTNMGGHARSRSCHHLQSRGTAAWAHSQKPNSPYDSRILRVISRERYLLIAFRQRMQVSFTPKCNPSSRRGASRT